MSLQLSLFSVENAFGILAIGANIWIKYMRERLNVLRFKTWRFFTHVLLHILNELREIYDMRGSAKDVIIYH